MGCRIQFLLSMYLLLVLAACGDSTSGPENYTTSSFTDKRDGEVYKTVEIGNLEWMAENLRYSAEGSDCYDYDESNCRIHGRLYRWSVAMDSSERVHCGDGIACDLADSVTHPHVQGVCPDGWRLPSYSDWYNVLRKDGLKAPDLEIKYSGFQNARGRFVRLGIAACFITSTESDADWAYHYSFSSDMYDSSGVAYKDVKTGAGSIRCVRDL